MKTEAWKRLRLRDQVKEEQERGFGKKGARSRAVNVSAILALKNGEDGVAHSRIKL